MYFSSLVLFGCLVSKPLPAFLIMSYGHSPRSRIAELKFTPFLKLPHTYLQNNRTFMSLYIPSTHPPIRHCSSVGYFAFCDV